MKTLSLEYCHVTPDTDWETEIHFANEYAPKILKAYSGDCFQKCIMIDDLHSKKKVGQSFVKTVVDKLNVKPDCIYLESAFLFLAAELVEKVDSRIGNLTNENERCWLRDLRDKYNSINDFLVSWREKDGTIMFSCPTLVAASYLYRLRILNGIVKSVNGDEIAKADGLINLLSSVFLQVEANAQTIIKATYPEALQKISWNFY